MQILFGALDCDPVRWKQSFEFLLCRIVHEFFKDPFEVGEGVHAVSSDLLDESVDDGTAPAGVLVSDKHPIFHPEFGWPDRAFGMVVVELDLAVEEAGFKVIPLVEGVVERFPKVALGKDTAGFVQVVDDFAKVVVVATGSEPAGFLAFQGISVLLFELALDVVDFPDLQEDPSGDFWMVHPSFVELASDVGEAADGDDVEIGVAFAEGAVSPQAITLEVAIEGGVSVVVDEDVVEAGIGPAFVPVEERAVLGVMIDPEVSGGGFAFAEFKAVDWGFVGLQVRALSEFDCDALVERQEAVGKVVVPVAHIIAGELDPVGGPKSPFLAIEGLVVAELFGEKEGSETGGEGAAGKEAGREWWGERDRVGVSFTNVGLAFDDLAGEGGWAGVEADADFFAQEAEEIGVGDDLWVGDGALDSGQAFEGVEEFVSASGSLGFCSFVSRRRLLVSIGGFGLFCFILEEGEEELVVAHFLALGTVDASEERGDEGFLGLEFSSKFGDFGGELFDLLVLGVDGVFRSKWRAGLQAKSFFYRTSNQGRWRPSRRSMPSASMARAVGLRMSF